MRRVPVVDPVSPKTTSSCGMAIAMAQTVVHQTKDSHTRLHSTRSPLKRSLSIVVTDGYTTMGLEKSTTRA